MTDIHNNVRHGNPLLLSKGMSVVLSKIIIFYFVASDAHDPELRPANMVQGLKALNTFFAKNKAQAIIENTNELFTIP